MSLPSDLHKDSVGKLTSTSYFLQSPHFLLAQFTPCESHRRMLVERVFSQAKFRGRSLHSSISLVDRQGQGLRNTRRDGRHVRALGRFVPLESPRGRSLDGLGLCDLDDPRSLLWNFVQRRRCRKRGERRGSRGMRSARSLGMEDCRSARTGQILLGDFCLSRQLGVEFGELFVLGRQGS